jgi:hypothetical protein
VAANLLLECEGLTDTFTNKALLFSKDSSKAEAVCRSTVLAMDKLYQSFVARDGVTVCRDEVTTLGISVVLPCRVVQDPVSRQANVSIFLPLHHFVTKTFSAAAHAGLDLSMAFNSIQASDASTAFALLDAPLTALVWAAQVGVGMWRRNGDAAASLAFNYSRPVLSRSFRDADLLAVQLSVFGLGGDVVLAVILERFEVRELLEGEAGDRHIREFLPHLLGELLRTLIHLTSQFPVEDLSLCQSRMHIHVTRCSV